MAIAILVLVFGGGIWFAYRAGVNAGSDSGIPLITAENGPIKVRPANPGGLEVPHQNVLVYDRLTARQSQSGQQGQPGKRPAEQLLPRPEEPVARSTIPMLPVTPDSVTSRKTEAASPTPTGGAVYSEDSTQGPPVEAPATAGTTGPQPDVDASVVTAMVPPPLAPTSAPIGPGYKVQLAALRTETEARETWDRLQRSYSGLLGRLQPQISRTDIGGKGVYYRLQAGPLSEKILAEMLCGELKSRKVECLIVQP